MPAFAFAGGCPRRVLRETILARCRSSKHHPVRAKEERGVVLLSRRLTDRVGWLILPRRRRYQRMGVLSMTRSSEIEHGWRAAQGLQVTSLSVVFTVAASAPSVTTGLRLNISGKFWQARSETIQLLGSYRLFPSGSVSRMNPTNSRVDHHVRSSRSALVALPFFPPHSRLLSTPYPAPFSTP
ncbi:hypothetical protein C8R45DRAFT_525494 [Mycena sanguinolenta]|nr:hypothetical protein C8R45DRAFT_525494 [Mycena sanguinolenta]